MVGSAVTSQLLARVYRSSTDRSWTHDQLLSNVHAGKLVADQRSYEMAESTDRCVLVRT